MLSVRNLSVRRRHGADVVNGVSFDVRAGEIVGIAGVEGNGQTRADRSDRGAGRSRARLRRDDARRRDRSSGSTRARAASAASRTFPKIATDAACCSISASTKTPSSACTTGRRSRIRRVMVDDREVRAAHRRDHPALRRAPAEPGAAGARAVGRQPAEADHRPRVRAAAAGCCWSRSRRAASTSARSSSSTASWWRCATPAARCCWCRPSSKK